MYMSKDLRRIALGIILIALIAAMAGFFINSDGSEADDGTNAKTYYYDQLSDYEKEIYNGLAASSIVIEDGKACIKCDVAVPSEFIGTDVDVTREALEKYLIKSMGALNYDRVDMFWIGGSYSVQPWEDADHKTVDHAVTYGVSGLVIEYGTSDSSDPKLSDSISKLSDAIQESSIAGVTIDTSSTYCKVRSIHEAVINLLTYYPTKPIPGTMDIRNTATAFIGDHIIVCEGYAKAFKILCDQYSVPCITVVGNGGLSTDKMESHMWNYVQMDNGKWYLVDCTWDDQDEEHGGMSKAYFLAGSGSIGFSGVAVSDSHVAGTSFSIPALSTTAYSADVEYTVVFEDYNGTILKSMNYMPEDDLIIPSDPARAMSDSTLYAFGGWSTDGINPISLPAKVTCNATYIATYQETARMYTVVFKDYDGTLILTTDLKFNDSIVVPADPARASDDYYTYAFSSWNPEVPASVNDSTFDYTFTAQYAASTNIHTVSGGHLIKCKTSSLVLSDSDIAEIKTGNLTVEFPIATVSFSKDATSKLAGGQTLTAEEKNSSVVDEEHRSEYSGALFVRVDFGTNNDVCPAGSVSIHVPCKVSDASKLEVVNISGYSVVAGSSYSGGGVDFSPASLSTFAIRGVDVSGDYDIGFFVPIIATLIIAFLGMGIVYKRG